MNVRDKINELVREYLSLIAAVPDGNASVEQQNEIAEKLDTIRFYTSRLCLINNNEIKL